MEKSVDKRFPFLIQEVECIDADVLSCFECKSVYRFSLTQATGPGLAFLLYCRFTNTIYTVNAWAESNLLFKREMDAFLKDASHIVFRPVAQVPSFSSIGELVKELEDRRLGVKDRPNFIANCPYCGTLFRKENWSKIEGVSMIPYIDLAEHFQAKSNNTDQPLEMEELTAQKIRRLQGEAQINIKETYGQNLKIKKRW